MTHATVFARCVEATVKVAVCQRVYRAVRAWFIVLLAPVVGSLGGFAKRADYIAVASSLSPPNEA